MDFQQNDRNQPNSRYDRQPSPYGQGFPLAALVCGLLSITLGCCNLSLPFGALGILFVVLCHRHNKPLDHNCRIALCLCVIGCIYGVLSLLYAFSSSSAQLSEDTALFSQQLNRMYEQFLSDGSTAN